MLDFGEFCYLDTPKTGSMFVVDFLKRHVTLDVQREKKHRPLGGPKLLKPGKLFFSSVRNPENTYRSLYAYGCDGEGLFHQRISPEKFGYSNLYSGEQKDFERWLWITLSRRGAKQFGPATLRALTWGYGPLSYRYFRTALLRPDDILPSWTSRKIVRREFAERHLPTRVLRTENLNADLADLVSTDLRPFIRDVSAALSELDDQDRRINASKTPKKFEIPRLLKWRIRQREWFLYENFYP